MQESSIGFPQNLYRKQIRPPPEMQARNLSIMDDDDLLFANSLPPSVCSFSTITNTADEGMTSDHMHLAVQKPKLHRHIPLAYLKDQRIASSDLILPNKKQFQYANIFTPPPSSSSVSFDSQLNEIPIADLDFAESN